MWKTKVKKFDNCLFEARKGPEKSRERTWISRKGLDFAEKAWTSQKDVDLAERTGEISRKG